MYKRQRFDNADELVYVGKANKSPNARVVVIFDTKGRNPMMNGLVIMPADIPVSYTHLDVYKRQGKGNSQCSGEMRRYWEEHQWRRRLSGLCLTLRCESQGSKRD